MQKLLTSVLIQVSGWNRTNYSNTMDNVPPTSARLFECLDPNSAVKGKRFTTYIYWRVLQQPTQLRGATRATAHFQHTNSLWLPLQKNPTLTNKYGISRECSRRQHLSRGKLNYRRCNMTSQNTQTRINQPHYQNQKGSILCDDHWFH